MTPFPWEQAIGIGLGVLRLSPQQFWSMTPRKLAYAIEAVTGHSPPLNRGTLAQLMTRYPYDVPARLAGRTWQNDRSCARALGVSATSFATAMSKAFADAAVGGKKFDDVLRQLALRLSDMAVAQAFQPLARSLAGGLGDLFGGVFGEDAGMRGRGGRAPDAINLVDKLSGLTAFASGGVIATPAYFPLGPGRLAVAGEAGGRKRFCRLHAGATDDSESR